MMRGRTTSARDLVPWPFWFVVGGVLALVAARLLGIITLSWWWVISPLLLLAAGALVIIGVVVIVSTVEGERGPSE